MALIKADYMYNGVVMAVHDGDTITINVDLGFNTWHLCPFRLLGCNARELKDEGGLEAQINLSLLLINKTVVVRSIKPDKYGERYLASVMTPDGINIVDKLIKEGWAAAWDGKGIKPLPPWPRIEIT